jgi:hypothetical protein
MLTSSYRQKKYFFAQPCSFLSTNIQMQKHRTSKLLCFCIKFTTQVNCTKSEMSDIKDIYEYVYNEKQCPESTFKELKFERCFQDFSFCLLMFCLNVVRVEDSYLK